MSSAGKPTSSVEELVRLGADLDLARLGVGLALLIKAMTTTAAP